MEEAGKKVYVEPEALASLAAYFAVSPGKIVGALKAMGHRVVLWSPLSMVNADGKRIIPLSMAERKLLEEELPSLAHEATDVPEPPSDGIIITSCLARKEDREYVFTAKELSDLFKTYGIDLELQEEAEVDLKLLPRKRYRHAVGLEDLRRMSKEEGEPIVFYSCPFKCLLNGGQPFPRRSLDEELEARRKAVSELL